jgi:uncharacterized protein YyaL (SSP411 family)
VVPTNRLAAEKSPYLLQHAHNPVDWYPWGPDAFDKAAREDKPIFLSIGYSTCHWCHVMEHESFENDAIAALLNRQFVAVKVDREERPDIDRIYMTFVQATTGSGGWPMSVFLTPGRKPFFGGTYFPPDNRYGRPGFPALLAHVAEAWKADRARIEASGRDIVEQLRQATSTAATHATILDDQTLLDTCFHALRRSYDPAHGGFGDAPKFPRPVVLNFLQRYAGAAGNEEARDMALHTLRAMAAGGMHDQLGGGFHRYSVDETWFVSHFEKMLYDQAQLAISYLEAYQITRDESYAAVARDILTYVLRDMTAPEGAFYSAEDADSPLPEDPSKKGEGAFYLWRWEEVDHEALRTRFGMEPDGNVHHDPHGEFAGKNILYAARAVDHPSLAASRAKLLAIRSARPRPYRDDKILTAWNGLMISAVARAAQVLDESAYSEAARRAAQFFTSRMWNGTVLLRRFRDGEAAIAGFLDDYAFLAQAFLDLYETDFDLAHLQTAIALTERMLALFEDRQEGAFFSTSEGDPDLLLRMKDDYDGAEPAGNSVAILNLLRLARITRRRDFAEAADRALQGLASRMTFQPVAVPQLLVALMFRQAPPLQIVLAGARNAEGTRAFLRRLRERFLPHGVVLLIDSAAARKTLAAFAPELAGIEPAGQEPTAYVCRDYACDLPTTDPDRFAALLPAI